MAVVKREQITFERATFTRIVKLSAKDGVFSCDLPKAVADLVGITEVTADSLKEVTKRFDKALKDYSEMQTSTRKVILYQTQANISLYQGGEWIHNLAEITFAQGVALSVVAGVFTETLIKGAQQTYRYDYLQSNLPKSITSHAHELKRGIRPDAAVHCMEWTQEREDFFIKLGTAIERIIVELQKFKDPNIAQTIADSGQFLLTS